MNTFAFADNLVKFRCSSVLFRTFVAVACIGVSSVSFAQMTEKETERKVCATAPSPLQPTRNLAHPLVWSTHKIAVGQTLSHLLDRLKVKPTVVLQLIKTSQYRTDLTRLKLNQVIEVGQTPYTCAFQKAFIKLTPTRTLVLQKQGKEIATSIQESKIFIGYEARSFQIKSALYYDGKQAGVPYKILVQLEDILGGHFDFTSDLRAGDTFKILYEKQFINQRDIGVGDIVAMEFNGHKKQLKVVRFQGEVEGFYAFNGKNMQTAFTRNPVIGRISSRYSKARYHPVLHTIRAHKGVDFAAPIGTPVRVTGTGIVQSIYHSKSYGLVVKVKHARNYETLYAHLLKTHKSLRVGQKVNKGETIAYVGDSGLSTGPHLHYEFKYKGHQVDPLKFPMPSGKNIEKHQQPYFIAQRNAVWTQFKQNFPPKFASDADRIKADSK